METQRDSGRGSALYTERTGRRQLEKGRQRQFGRERIMEIVIEEKERKREREREREGESKR